MSRRILVVLAACSIATWGQWSLAQRPDFTGPDGGPRRGMPRMPLLSALDADGNGEISSEEIDQSVTALKALDKNGDGIVDRDEMRPDFGARDTRDGERDRRAQRGPDTDRGPAARSAGPEGPRRRGPDGRGPNGDRGDGPRGRSSGQLDGPPGGPPSPTAFVDRAMHFDGNEDGQLSRDELMKMAEAMPWRGGRARGDEPAGRPARRRPAAE